MSRTSPRTLDPLRIFAVATCLAVGLAGCTSAESREAPEDEDPAAGEPAAEFPAAEPAEEAPSAVPQGTSMTFTVDETISTETHTIGDRFTASLGAPVTDVSGEPLLPQGTLSRWAVTESTTEDGQAVLAVELESIQVDGEWEPVVATVTRADVESDDPDSGGETAAKIGVGAAAGALIGQILGENTESTLRGAGVGAAVGAAVALSTRGGSATLPAGSTVTVVLEERLPVM